MKHTDVGASMLATVLFVERQMKGKEGQLKKLEGRPVSDSAL